MKAITLGNGTVTIVSDEDYEDLSAFKWQAGRKGYVMRTWRCRCTGAAHQHIEYMARRILGLERGDKLQADHIDKDFLNNQRSNLRKVTPKENCRDRIVNHRKYPYPKGIYYRKSDGGLNVYRNGKYYGSAKTLEEAQAML